MSRDKIDANDIMDSKNDGGILNSDIMKALEDIDYDISQSDLDSASPDELDNDEFKEIEQDAITLHTIGVLFDLTAGVIVLLGLSHIYIYL